MNKSLVRQFLEQSSFSYTENEPMRLHTTFRIGGNADFFVTANSETDVQKIKNFCDGQKIPLQIIGNGSNMLVSDSGIEGIVLSLGFLKTITYADSTVICGAGATLFSLCNFALKEGLSGLEFAYGIPGSVGGAVYMNAGAYGGEIKDVLKSVTYLDANGQIKKICAEDAALGYRTSIFKNNGGIILSAEFNLKQGNPNEIKAKMQDFICRRQQKQPLEFPSAGSTFKRPEGYFAGALIEGAGLKGKTVGGAQVSEKHAGFVINKNDATASDVLRLIKEIQQTILEKDGVCLEPEIIFIGRT